MLIGMGCEAHPRIASRSMQPWCTQLAPLAHRLRPDLCTRLAEQEAPGASARAASAHVFMRCVKRACMPG